MALTVLRIYYIYSMDILWQVRVNKLIGPSCASHFVFVDKFDGNVQCAFPTRGHALTVSDIIRGTVRYLILYYCTETVFGPKTFFWGNFRRLFSIQENMSNVNGPYVRYYHT
jgi:hypothetical protein